MKKRRRHIATGLLLVMLFAGLALFASSSCCHIHVTERSPDNPVPIIYHPQYNITFFGIEKLHPFDSTKYGRVFDMLVERGLIDPKRIVRPGTVTDEQLRLVHTERYLDSLKQSKTVAHIAEMPPLAKLPNRSLQCNLLKPKRLATGGTIRAAQLALAQHTGGATGWAINLSGGYHHAKADSGEGFCVFADIPIAAEVLWQTRPELRIMVIDLDAHQGNGFESIFQDDERVVMYDLYNSQVYPDDQAARAFIDHDVPIASGTGDKVYLKLLKNTLSPAMAAANADLIIYNAGTDIFEDDPLGGLSISREGIIERDDYVFRAARDAGVPVAMVMSGGYTKDTAGIIADSIENLFEEKLISAD